MSANEKTATVPVYTRLPVDLAQRLEREAAAADRTMAGQVRHIVKAHLTKQGRES
jgi:predicted DNA-binding protein